MASLGSRQKPKPGKSLQEDLGGASNFAFSNENWLEEGFLLFQESTGDFARYFWIGQPLVIESEMGPPNQSPAFGPCADKMMTVLLDLAGVREENGIRPHSLKVATISGLMGEIAKGKKNLSQLAPQGNYRAATSHDMGMAYSRNLAQQQQIFLSKFAQKTSRGDTNAESPPNDLPEFSEISQGGGSSLNKEFHVVKPMDWDLSILQKENL